MLERYDSMEPEEPEFAMDRRRFWLIYAVAWLPYALSYFLLFRLMRISSHPELEVFYNIAPAMIAGAAVVRWCALVPWRLHKKTWFYPAQLAGAIGYALLWYAGVLVTGSVGHALETGHFVLDSFSGYALQWQFFSGIMIYGNIAGAVYILQANASLLAEERRRERAEALQMSAELSALRAQLNPHFLFNTLNSIMALAGPGQPRTTQAVAQLASMLRYTLHQDTSDIGVSLRQELAFTEQYLALEALRLGDRLNVVSEIDSAALPCQLPPLTLQPLVENAVRHGISPVARGGTICIRAKVRESLLQIEVADDGAGTEPARLIAGSGIGVRTVRQRLALFSNGLAELTFRSAPGCGCSVTLALPLDASDEPTATPEASWVST